MVPSRNEEKRVSCGRTQEEGEANTVAKMQASGKESYKKANDDLHKSLKKFKKVCTEFCMQVRNNKGVVPLAEAALDLDVV